MIIKMLPEVSTIHSLPDFGGSLSPQFEVESERQQFLRAVPRWISVVDLEHGKEKIYESISEFNLYASKDSRVVVKGVVSEQTGLKMGNVLVHVVDGVVMDAEFEGEAIFHQFLENAVCYGRKFGKDEWS
ncbi:UNVERIFIED_CONTAM: hypothetical protein Sindi_0176900 [Sesamum indicum]